MRSGQARIFVALELSDPARALAEEATLYLRLALRGRAGLRFTSSANLHVTLAFLGETPAARLASVREVVTQVAAQHAPIDVEVGGLGAFPRSDAAKVLWLGFGSGAPGLESLVADLHERLRVAGHDLERRAWTGHVTLARCRSRVGIDARSALESGPKRRVVCRIEAIALMESRLTVDGPSYTRNFRALLSGGTQRERV
jgi:2'-5' RNA ligase